MDDQLKPFATYLSSLWNGEFTHSYKISHSAVWNKWKGLELCKDRTIWHCTSISQAAENYSWTDIDGGIGIERLSDELRRNVVARDNRKLVENCLDIFRWGGVGRDTNGTPNRSKAWVLACGADGTLAEKLELAVTYLTDQALNLEMFDGERFLMNSAMTKVYAAADPQRLIIYDGRVGAALGLIARDFLYGIGENRNVPDVLAFGWGSSQAKRIPGQRSKRDPSDSRFQFPPLFGVGKDQRHADMMRRASLLLSDVNSKFEPGKAPGLAALEQALFMIGFDVSRRLSLSHQTAASPALAISS